MLFGHLLRTIIKTAMVIVDGSDVDRVCRLPGTLQLMCSFREDFINTAYQKLVLGWIARICVSLASIVKVETKASIKSLFLNIRWIPSIDKVADGSRSVQPCLHLSTRSETKSRRRVTLGF